MQMPIDSLELELQSTPVLGSNFQAPKAALKAAPSFPFF